MKKIIAFFILLLLPFTASAKELDIYLFYGGECPYCHNEIEFLDTVQKQYGDNINIHKYEVWHNKDNASLMKKVKKELNMEEDGVPFTVIGKQGIIGYNEKFAEKITKLIDSNLVTTDANVVNSVQNNKKITDKKTKNEELVFPIGGNINVKDTPVFVQTLLLVLSTIFSPNGLWFILFLTAFLLVSKERKNILSLTFIIGASITYLLVIFNILKLNSMGEMILKTIIAIIPITIGALILNKHINNPQLNFKYKKILILFGMFVLGLFIGFIFYNYADGIPNLLNIILDINNLNTNIYHILYIILFTLFSFIIIKLLDKVLDKIPNKYIISFIILLVLSIVLIFFPNLFIFTS